MTRKILSLKDTRNKEPKQVEKALKDVSKDDPQQRFLNDVDINPN